MKIRCIRKSEQGVTLAEVVVATAVVAIFASGLIGSFNYGFYTMEQVRENQRASQILVEASETARLYSWDNIYNGTWIPTQFTNVYDPQAINPESPGIKYYGTLSITNFPFSTSYSSKMREIDITVRWTNRHGVVRTRSITTFVAQDGSQNYVW
jgi:prepilin-type N-terminal cleavage/methylation domain-containing protein